MSAMNLVVPRWDPTADGRTGKNVSDPSTNLISGVASPSGLLIYTATAFLCAMLVCVLFGIRVSNLQLTKLHKLKGIRVIVLLTYLCAMSICFGLGLLSLGLQLLTLTICRAGIVVCLIFYLLEKVLIYTFLVERAHALRVSKRGRFRDWVWISGAALVAVGSISVLILAIMFPKFYISALDGECHVGMAPGVLGGFLAWDIITNVLLTGVFTYLLWPTLCLYFGKPSPCPECGSMPPRFTQRPKSTKAPLSNSNKSGLVSATSECQQDKKDAFSMKLRSSTSHLEGGQNPEIGNKMKNLVRKSLVASVLSAVPTIVNLSLLLHLDGKEQGWFCVTFCTLDVTWQVCVMHYLTVDPASAENEI